MSRARRIAAPLVCAVALWGVAPHAGAAPVRDDYANRAFVTPLDAGLRAFYTRDFVRARAEFEAALAVVPDNTLALAFLNAAAAQKPGALDSLIDAEEDAVAQRPTALAHERLAFSDLFAAPGDAQRAIDAREELGAALALDPESQAAHTAMGIMREDERSAHRAKAELLAALRTDPYNVLAREYLAQIYQTDLDDPQRALATIIDIPNLIPEYADIDFHVASVLEDLGEDSAAIRYATRGLETDVGHVGEAGRHGYTLLAQIYLHQNKPADARRVLRAAVAAGTDATYAATLLEKIGGK